MSLIPLNLVFEDQLSEFVMLKLADNAKKFHIANSYSEGGFGYIKKNIHGFNDAAKGCPFFVLTDLDAGNCAPTLITSWLQKPTHSNLIFRVAVREVEAWLLADVEGFAQYIGVSKGYFSYSPDDLADPKATLMRLVKKTRKRTLREDILPKDKYASIGPNYNERLAEFVIDYWNVNRATIYSDSLRRTVNHLSRFKVKYN